jgi:hypothetical protein
MGWVRFGSVGGSVRTCLHVTKQEHHKKMETVGNKSTCGNLFFKLFPRLLESFTTMVIAYYVHIEGKECP